MMAGITPTRTSLNANVAPSAAIVRSHAAVRPSPPPKACPLMRPITGFGELQIVFSTVTNGCSPPSAAVRPPLFRSAPAQNAAPAPVSTTVRTPGSASAVARWVPEPVDQVRAERVPPLRLVQRDPGGVPPDLVQHRVAHAEASSCCCVHDHEDVAGVHLLPGLDRHLADDAVVGRAAPRAPSSSPRGPRAPGPWSPRSPGAQRTARTRPGHRRDGSRRGPPRTPAAGSAAPRAARSCRARCAPSGRRRASRSGTRGGRRRAGSRCGPRPSRGRSPRAARRRRSRRSAPASGRDRRRRSSPRRSGRTPSAAGSGCSASPTGGRAARAPRPAGAPGARAPPPPRARDRPRARRPSARGSGRRACR